MIVGVSEGFTKELELVGVGYRASNQGQKLDLALGFSHNIVLEVAPEVKLVVSRRVDFDINKNFLSSFSMFNYDFELAMKCVTNIIFRRVYAKTLGITAKEIDAISFTWNTALKERKAYVMNHPKKIEIARKILEARPFSKAITFSATIKQSEEIKIGQVVNSKNTNKKNRINIEEFNRLQTGVLNTAKSLDAGADIKGLNLAIILCNSSSPNQKTQRIGRIIRYEENKISEVFTLVIKNTMENNWFLNSNKGKYYMEIDEDDLDQILYTDIDYVGDKTGESKNLIFRL
jgi:superfamily II DNA or RNA helicase